LKRKLSILRGIDVLDHKSPRRPVFLFEKQVVELLHKKQMRIEQIIQHFQENSEMGKNFDNDIRIAIKHEIIKMRRKGLVRETDTGFIELTDLFNTTGASEEEIYDAFYRGFGPTVRD